MNNNVENNETYMKDLGEKKVWKAIEATGSAKKKISSTQIGQQLLFDEALRMFPDIKDWIFNKVAKAIRKDFTSYFNDDELIIQKIVEVMLIMAGDVEGTLSDSKPAKSRYKKITTVNSRILPELSFENTWRFIEIVIDSSNYFEIEKSMNRDGEFFKTSVSYKCTLSKVILNKLSFAAANAYYPMIMLEKPIDWSYSVESVESVDEETGEITCELKNILKGGYRTYQYDMIRSNFLDIDYSCYPQNIFDCVNYIQSTPWVINKAVLAQLKQDIKLPKKSDYLKMEYPGVEAGKWDIDLEDEDLDMTNMEIKKLKLLRVNIQDKLKLYNAEKSDYDSAVGKFRAIRLAMEIATRYKDCDELYFPHSFDFRGRVYPLPIGLSPQGSDEVKAMLDYKYGEVLDDRGIRWALAYLASLYGDDKLAFDKRVERGQELLHVDYKDADEPYQFLSHQIALKEILENPEAEFKGRIHLDACNSGSQFTSAITGDKEGCEATNVLPTYDEDGKISRKDAYLLVANKSSDEAKERIKNEIDKEKLDVLIFLKELLESNGRKLCKRPTMVSNYGGTATGRANMLWDMFREFKCSKKYITKQNSVLLSTIIGNSIKGVLNGGKAFEEYVQKMSTLIARKNKPIQWTTSDGFFVTHKKNKQLKIKKVSCWLPGARRKTSINKVEYDHNNLSSAKMRSAISPNYIHALDAELLRRVALRMCKEGILYSDWIHDSYGCHPNHVDLMLRITKEEFIDLVDRDPLGALDIELRQQVAADRDSQRKLNKIKIPRFDENMNIDKCIESDWFFS